MDPSKVLGNLVNPKPADRDRQIAMRDSCCHRLVNPELMLSHDARGKRANKWVRSYLGWTKLT